MIKLYTKEVLIKDNLILSNDAFFQVKGVAQHIMKDTSPYLKALEGICETKGTSVKTPLGWSNIINLSTGYKVLLNMVYCHQNSLTHTMNLTECGPNVLSKAFELADLFALPVFLQHIQLYQCQDREFLVDDKEHISTILDLVSYISRR